MQTQTDYEKWHLNNEHVPQILPLPVWEHKMAALQAIEARLRRMDPESILYDELDKESSRLCWELGL